MLDIEFTSGFKKDIKRKLRQGFDVRKLDEIILSLRRGDVLPERNKDHGLLGKYKGYRECHIEPDWLLIYRVNERALILTAVRTGSHSELFG